MQFIIAVLMKGMVMYFCIHRVLLSEQLTFCILAIPDADQVQSVNLVRRQRVRRLEGQSGEMACLARNGPCGLCLTQQYSQSKSHFRCHYCQFQQVAPGQGPRQPTVDWFVERVVC